MKIYNLILVAGLFIFSACAQSQQTEQSNVKNLSAVEFKAAIKSGEVQLVDIRTPNEYNMGHINGAIMVDFYSSDFKANLNKLDKNVPIYIYCRSGSRTSKTIGLLQSLGFKEIVNLHSGLIDWQRSGYSLSQG